MPHLAVRVALPYECASFGPLFTYCPGCRDGAARISVWNQKDWTVRAAEDSARHAAELVAGADLSAFTSEHHEVRAGVARFLEDGFGGIAQHHRGCERTLGVVDLLYEPAVG